MRLLMYVCMHACTCVCACVCLNAFMRVCNMNACVYVYAYVCMYVCKPQEKSARDDAISSALQLLHNNFNDKSTNVIGTDILTHVADIHTTASDDTETTDSDTGAAEDDKHSVDVNASRHHPYNPDLRACCQHL